VNHVTDLPAGVSAEVAIYVFSRLYGIVKGDLVLLEAAAHQAVAMHLQNVPTVDAAVSEFLIWEKRRGVGERHHHDLASRLKPFRAAFTCRIDALTVPQVDIWLGQLEWSNRTRNNYHNAVMNFLTWCRRVKHYTKAEFIISKSIVEQSDNEIWKPDQMRELLVKASSDWPRLVPYLAIGAFAKVRTSELLQLDWEQVRFDEGTIVIRRKQAKTRRVRKIVMPMNLIEWIRPYGKLSGRIVTSSNIHRELRRLAASVGLKWKRNALRNSGSTYHAIVSNDLGLVSREAGNSPRVLEAEYLEIVGATAEHAKTWFEIFPMQGQVCKLLALEFKT